jgi:spore germination protein
MRKKNFWISTLAVLLTFSLLWGFSENRRAADFRIASENQNQRSFSDFVSNLDGLETNLAKSRVASTPLQQLYYLGQTSLQSEITVKDLSLLPAEEVGLAFVDQFLNQIGDFSRSLSQQIVKGDQPDSKQEETLAAMHDRLIDVNRKIQELAVNLQTNNIVWVDKPSPPWMPGVKTAAAASQAQEAGADEPSSLRASLEQLDASLQKLPPFTYSGQTDTHAVPEPLGLPDLKVKEEQAHQAAQEFIKSIGYQNTDLKLSATTSGVFEGYSFTAENISIDVCKRGGVITFFRDERPLGLQKLSAKQAAAKAVQTLQAMGWKSFIATAVEDFGGYIQMDAVYVQDNVRIYPDKIRLVVTKDNGQIIGYDATPYWLFHHQRTLKPQITAKQAKSKLRQDVQIKENGMAVISLPGYAEAFCYEYRVHKDGEDYLIYINAQDATEEKIQRIVITPRGEFLQ